MQSRTPKPRRRPSFGVAFWQSEVSGKPPTETKAPLIFWSSWAQPEPGTPGSASEASRSASRPAGAARSSRRAAASCPSPSSRPASRRASCPVSPVARDRLQPQVAPPGRAPCAAAAAPALAAPRDPRVQLPQPSLSPSAPRRAAGHLGSEMNSKETSVKNLTALRKGAIRNSRTSRVFARPLKIRFSKVRRRKFRLSDVRVQPALIHTARAWSAVWNGSNDLRACSGKSCSSTPGLPIGDSPTQPASAGHPQDQSMTRATLEAPQTNAPQADPNWQVILAKRMPPTCATCEPSQSARGAVLSSAP